MKLAPACQPVVPIEYARPIRTLTQEEFRRVDRRLMGVAFDVHNDLGRFFDEIVYKDEIAHRWRDSRSGEVDREMRVTLRHDGFEKAYFVDVLINGGVLVEAKCAEALAPAHRMQGLNYLLMTGLQHGRLLNFRTPRVEYEFLSTRLDNEQRRLLTFDESAWRPVNAASSLLRDRLRDLLSDWGAFLEIALYREAITFLLGGSEHVVKSIPVRTGECRCHEQPVHLLDCSTAFRFTASTRQSSTLRDHLQRFLNHTPLRHLQWVNFNHQCIELVTLTSEAR